MALIYKAGAAQFAGLTQQPLPSLPTLLASPSSLGKILVADIANGKIAQVQPFRIQTPQQLLQSSNFVIPASSNAVAVASYSKKTQFVTVSDTRLMQNLTKPSVKFTPFEELTGITSTRPEILLVTNFRPIYSDKVNVSSVAYSRRADLFTPGFNEFGEFLEAQIQLQNLKHDAINKLINDLKLSDENLKFMLEQKELQFLSHLKNLESLVNYLYETVTSVNVLKQIYNTRNEQLKVDYDQIVFDHFRNTTLGLSVDFDDGFEPDMTFIKLLGAFGFVEDNVRTFSSTKIYLQTLYELKNMWKGYSNNLLGANMFQLHDDTNPVTINQHKVSNFNHELSKVISVPFEKLVTPFDTNFLGRERLATDLVAQDVLGVVNSVKTTFDTILGGLHFADDESKLGFLCQFLTKEFSFSSAISNKQFAAFLQTEYGYPLSDNLSNEGMFDAIVGNIGSKITDAVDTFSANSLSTLAQKDVKNVAVLPLEMEYIDYDNSTYTPGSVFLIDQVLNINDGGYDVTNLFSYSSEIGSHVDRLVNVIKFLNFVPDNPTQSDTSNNDFTTKLLKSDDLFNAFLHTFVDTTIDQLPLPNIISADSVAVFNAATTDNYLKSLLFMYVITRTFGEEGNLDASILDTLITEIAKRLGATLGTSNFSDLFTVDKFLVPNTSKTFSSVSAVQNELRYTNNFLTSFFGLFKGVFDAFNNNDLGILNHFTRYSHIQDTTLMLVVFETLLTVVNKFVNKIFTGQFTSKTLGTIGQKMYTVRIGSAQQNTPSVFSVQDKLAEENFLVLELTFTLLSHFRLMKAASDNVIHNLQQEQSTQSLNTLLKLLTDQKLLSILMNEQQVHLLQSSLDDTLHKFYEPSQQNMTNVDAELRGSGRDDVTLFDDSLITPNVRKVLYSFLGQDQFLSKRGHNARLLSVGIPCGFSQKLRERIKLDNVDSKSFNQKQLDIITLNVYKVDVEYQDLVFKPQTFLFEINRYPVRNEKQINQVSLKSSMTDILAAVPTRDYSYVAGKSVSRQTSADENQQLTTPDYDFLTSAQKQEIQENHVSSYLLEQYAQLLTGMKLSEFDFYVQSDQTTPQKAAPIVVDALLDARNFQNVGDNGASAAEAFARTVPRIVTSDVSAPAAGRFASLQSVQEIPTSKQTSLDHDAGLISDFSTMRTAYTDETIDSRTFFNPKAFERVFNVSVDPDDFIIDIDETLKTPAGKDLFAKLLYQQRVVSVDNQGAVYPSVGSAAGNYRLVERQITQGDLIFEKYFVTIGTVLKSEV